MTDERRIAIVQSASDLRAAMRAQVGSLNLTYAVLDQIAGYTDTYSTKMLAECAQRHFSEESFDAYLGALCIDLIAVHSPEKESRLRALLKKKLIADRERPMPAPGTHEVLTFRISRRKLRRMARLGGKKRAEKMTPKQRSKSARKAAMAMHRKRRRLARRATPSAKLLPAPSLEPCAS